MFKIAMYNTARTTAILVWVTQPCSRSPLMPPSAGGLSRILMIQLRQLLTKPYGLSPVHLQKLEHPKMNGPNLLHALAGPPVSSAAKSQNFSPWCLQRLANPCSSCSLPQPGPSENNANSRISAGRVSCARHTVRRDLKVKD